MPTVFGYCRHPSNAIRAEHRSVDVQTTEIGRRCRDWSLGSPEFMVDAADTRTIPWLERPAGKQLASRVQSGDLVIVADALMIFTSCADLLAVVEDWRARGIEICFLQADPYHSSYGRALITEGEVGEQLVAGLRLFTEFWPSVGRERTRWALRVRMSEGRRYTRHAGYGFRWGLRKGEQRRVPNQAERRVIDQLVRWRQDGRSLDELYFLLRKQKAKTRDRREWSRSRIYRALRAERAIADSACAGQHQQVAPSDQHPGRFCNYSSSTSTSPSSPKTYGYAWVALFRREDPPVWNATIEAYVAEKHLPELCGIYTDTDPTCRFLGNWPPARRALNTWLRRGDHVVIPCWEAGFSSLQDVRNQLSDWEGKGITLHVCDAGSGKALEAPGDRLRHFWYVLVSLVQMRRRYWSGTMREILRQRQAHGIERRRQAP